MSQLALNVDLKGVVAGNADRAHVFLDCGADNIADRPMITEIDDFDSVTNKLQVDRIDRAVMPVANRNGG